MWLGRLEIVTVIIIIPGIAREIQMDTGNPVRVHEYLLGN